MRVQIKRAAEALDEVQLGGRPVVVFRHEAVYFASEQFRQLAGQG
jgi:hypothetical protein